MDPLLDHWIKNTPVAKPHNRGNATQALLWRQYGLNVPRKESSKVTLQEIAEDNLVQKTPLKIRCCDLPGHPRSTFLMVFSPDGTKVASTHGNHNIYVSELASGKHVRVLKGHPRTPWCISFHPSHPQLIGSGCLGGQVRVWDLSGGSETWNVENETVIASLAFHPRDQLLVIATSNELYFWNWNQPAPMAKVSTNSANEKVRYVAFDSLGYKLITGISVWPSTTTATATATATAPATATATAPATTTTTTTATAPVTNLSVPTTSQNEPTPPGPTDNNSNLPDSRLNGSENRPDPSGATQEHMVTSYQNLVQRYDSLVRNYHRLFAYRPDAETGNTTDRGTDPMESVFVEGPYNRMTGTRGAVFIRSRPITIDTSSQLIRPTVNEGDPATNSQNNGLFNMDGLNLGNGSGDSASPNRGQDSTAESTRDRYFMFGSRPSAFQPLGDNERNENMYRLPRRVLPNPFSTVSLAQMAAVQAEMNNESSTRPNSTATTTPGGGSSRTSVFLPYRSPISLRRRISINTNLETFDDTLDGIASSRNSTAGSQSTEVGRHRSPSGNSQHLLPDNIPGLDPERLAAASPQVAQTLNASLDLIRDILRDSGTRLLNLITDMSLSTLESFERNLNDTRAPNDTEETRSRRNRSSRITLVTSRIRRELISSASDSDSDPSLEVNIYRTRNSSATERNASNVSQNDTSPAPRPTSRMVVDLDLDDDGEVASEQASTHLLNGNRINITVSNNNTFRIRTSNEGNNPNTTPHDTSVSYEETHRSAEETRTRASEGSETGRNDQSLLTGNAETENSRNQSRDNERTETRNNDTGAIRGNVSNVEANVRASLQDSINLEQDTTPQLDPQPSTSRDTAWVDEAFRLGPNAPGSGINMPPDEAFRKVKVGVSILQQHTNKLTDIWLRGTRYPITGLRIMWDNLRRQIISLQRSNSRQSHQSHYTRSALERCRMISELSRRSVQNSATENANSRASNASTSSSATPETETSDPINTPSTSGTARRDQPPTSQGSEANVNRLVQALNRSRRAAFSSLRSSVKLRSGETARRRLQSNQRWRSDDEVRRRPRMSPMMNNTSRRPRDNHPPRPFEIHFIRHEIRLRAMQVLSTLFNIMMSCLEERELSTHVITMLKCLKKALGLTCLMLVTNGLNRRGDFSLRGEQRNAANRRSTNTRSQGHRSLNDTTTAEEDNAMENRSENTQLVVDTEIPNTTSASIEDSSTSTANAAIITSNTTSTVNPTSTITASDQPSTSRSNFREDNDSNSISSWPTSDSDHLMNEDRIERKDDKPPKYRPETAGLRSISFPETSNDSQSTSEIAETSPLDPNRWSPRLAVQISEANRNFSTTANRRKNLYYETRREKTLHKKNPVAHPLIRKKVSPPLFTNRIPNSRTLPNTNRQSHQPRRHILPLQLRPDVFNTSTEPVAGPSGTQPASNRTPFQNIAGRRANLVRLSQLHARLRAVARNRYRIRLYTPSSVREMFEVIQSSGIERETLPDNGDGGPRERYNFAPLSYTISLRNLENGNGQPDRSRPLDSLFNNLAVPLVQVNDLPVNENNANGGSPPRVYEYLQPIFLAQEGVGDEEAGGAGAAVAARMAGLFEAGLMGEPVPAPSHRVQAWDFTARAPPDISDGTKNVVVSRCRIHNDASIDISKDGRLLVALLPVSRVRQFHHQVGVYSLEWGRLGACLVTATLEQSAVSVALSPTARHLAVGLGTRRVITLPHHHNAFALLYKLDPPHLYEAGSGRSGLEAVRVLDQSYDQGFTSLNCLRWAPEPGQGLVYANNTGQLIILT